MREILSPSLADRTTIHLGGKAIAELWIESDEDLWKLPERLKYYGGKAFFLGMGSNLLARDGELPLTIVRLPKNRPIEIIGYEEEKTLVRAHAGTPLSKLLGFCLKNGLSGLEGLTGIPGSVGGALMMNAGSFGVSTMDHVHMVKCMADMEIMTCEKRDIEARYRGISLPWPQSACLILEVIFALTPMQNNVIFKRMSFNFIKKKSTQPLNEWSGGCAFKNPSPQLSAGKLLDEAGLKGRSLGGMALSPMHANFLINTGNGSSTAALELMELAREEVGKRYNVTLEAELKIIP